MHQHKLKRCVSALGFALSVAAASSALAADNGFYIGASAGVTDWDISTSDLLSTGSVDNSDTGYKIFLGYDFNKNWGLEFGYVDLGKYEFSGTYLGVPVRGDAKITAYNFGVVGTYPVNNNFGIFGKLGAYAWDTKASASSGSVSARASDSGTNVYGGLGLKYSFTNNFSIRGEWERYHDADNPIDLYSVGFTYKF